MSRDTSSIRKISYDAGQGKAILQTVPLKCKTSTHARGEVAGAALAKPANMRIW